ncbi:MAG: hypothetical protein KC420_20680, partial [Myxococcales bacterium]|nr:hypothetical protein [Myxococcales bacterium]
VLPSRPMLTLFAAAAPSAPASGGALEEALRWLAAPADPPLLLILGLCLAAAVAGRLDRKVA